MPRVKQKHIVIIGGGFAGINLAKKLASDNHYHITLVDKNNYNFFPPLIYQVASGFLETSGICYPFRKLFRKHTNIRFRMSELIAVDTVKQVCRLNNGQIAFDYLVFACGAYTNYFGNENIRKNAIPMKTVEDALHMRNTLLQTLEQACRVTDLSERKKLMTIVVAGGGSTGVEVAGVLAELKKEILKKDYPELQHEPGQIFLVSSAAQLLEQMSELSHQQAYSALSKLGVCIRLNTQVLDFFDDKVILSNEEIIPAKNLIWAAGIVAHPITGIPSQCIGKGKRMITDAYNQVVDLDGVYAIGDTCIQLHDPAFPNGHPQLAQTAIQQGLNLAGNLRRMMRGEKMQPFLYRDKGNMAIIGRNIAVCDLFKSRLHIGGFAALLLWLFVHLTSLINYRNKLKTLYNWTAAYFTRDQPLRMIIRPNPGQNE